MSKQINITKIMGIGMLSLFLLGCSEEKFLLTEATEGMETVMENPSGESEKNQEQALEKEDNISYENLEAENSMNHQVAVEPVMIAVHVCGAIKQPGVYFLEEGARIVDAISQAGGFSEEADQEYVNQALVLQDGMKIDIPTKEEVNNGYVGNEGNGISSVISVQGAETKENGKINLNTADEALLRTLPGIGESRAKSILAYRDTHGPFEKIEDIMKVSGIKEAAFEKIKDKIIVSK
ncbi:MAG: helix-hairpin-helix domain-containing protein [Lachnospiraceae bacterium]|nr:helix-hairpin-helix domain-containing protein [Lachnospiraceae bacterium]